MNESQLRGSFDAVAEWSDGFLHSIRDKEFAARFTKVILAFRDIACLEGYDDRPARLSQKWELAEAALHEFAEGIG